MGSIKPILIVFAIFLYTFFFALQVEKNTEERMLRDHAPKRTLFACEDALAIMSKLERESREDMIECLVRLTIEKRKK